MTHAHIITGSFGAGKTTAIRRLMAQKPEAELWVVILNEFTDAGLDALRVAESAHGRYDVRLVAGGCLCCVGELEFGKQLRDIQRALKPSRLLIEPSGAAHAAAIVDELAAFEAQRALTLDSVVCLVDALDAVRIGQARGTHEWSQVQSADVLLLSKPDLADAAARKAFAAVAADQYPLKQFVGECRDGALPPEALHHYSRAPAWFLVPAGAAAAAVTQEFPIAGFVGGETQVEHLGLWAVSWILPPQLTFSRVVLEPRLNWMLDAFQAWTKRLKGVFRTGPGPSWLVQSHGRGLHGEDSAYRRDSRLEIVLTARPDAGFLDAWRSLLHDAALAPR